MPNITRPTPPAPLNPSTRVLLGPGPSEVHPRVLAALGFPLLGHLDRTLVARVDVPDHAHPRIRRKHPVELLGREGRAVRHDHHARVLAVADPNAAAVMDRDPRGTGSCVHEGVEERPVGNRVGAVAHRLRLAVR